MRETYVMRGGELIPKRLAPPKIIRNDPRVHVIGDVMAPVRSMANGKIYDSKGKYRSDLRAMGLTEVGTDSAAKRPQPQKPYNSADLRRDVEIAIAQVKEGRTWRR